MLIILQGVVYRRAGLKIKLSGLLKRDYLPKNKDATFCIIGKVLTILHKAADSSIPFILRKG